MTRGISLHMGLNRIDPTHYGTDGALRGCINDAQSMSAIARSAGFETTLITNEQATSDSLFAILGSAQKTLKAGDTLLVTYAGHGAETPDLNHDEGNGEPDETWCLYDRMVVDDELFLQWSRFAAGVRIVVVSDSCHSQTVARSLQMMAMKLAASLPVAELRSIVAAQPVIDMLGRLLPPAITDSVNATHRELYTRIQKTTPPREQLQIAATGVTLAACRDDETAGDAADHGLFTQTLLRVWNEGKFRGSYLDFIGKIQSSFGAPNQHPQIDSFGAPDEAFKREQPFTISSTPRAEKGGKKIMTQKNDVLDLDSELRALKNGGQVNGSRQVLDTSNGNGNGWARMELLVPRHFVIDAPNDDIYTFLQTDGADALMKTVIGIRNISIPRGVEGSAGCKVEHDGHEGKVSCKAEIHF